MTQHHILLILATCSILHTSPSHAFSFNSRHWTHQPHQLFHSTSEAHSRYTVATQRPHTGFHRRTRLATQTFRQQQQIHKEDAILQDPHSSQSDPAPEEMDLGDACRLVLEFDASWIDEFVTSAIAGDGLDASIRRALDDFDHQQSVGMTNGSKEQSSPSSSNTDNQVAMTPTALVEAPVANGKVELGEGPFVTPDGHLVDTVQPRRKKSRKGVESSQTGPSFDTASIEQMSDAEIRALMKLEDVSLRSSGSINGHNGKSRDPPSSTSVAQRDESSNSGTKVLPTNSSTVESGVMKSNVKNNQDIRKETVSKVTKGDGEMIVVFQSGGSKRTARKARLRTLLDLGYSQDEILSLESSALGTIVSERISRPRSGVPPRWLVPDHVRGKGREDVQILNQTQATTSEAVRETRQLTEELPPQQTASSGRAKGRRSAAETPAPPRRPRRENVPRDGRAVADRRGAATKPIYSGRPSPQPLVTARQRPDPPATNSFWPNMDTFRRLLRQEAAMRMSILGEGAADGIKSECEWRLNLYKDWLWTLHQGVGNSFVESRSERAARLRQAATIPQPLAPPRKKTRRINNNFDP